MGAAGAANWLPVEEAEAAEAPAWPAPSARVPELMALVRPLSEMSDRLGAAWDDLAADAAEANAYAERWFVMAAARHLTPAGGVRRLEIWQKAGGAERLIALLPLCLADRYGRSPVRHVTNWVHYHSFLGTPLIRSGYERSAWTAILGALDEADWARGLFHLNGIVDGGPVHRGLQEAAAAMGRPCDIVHRTERALLASPLSAADYYECAVRKKKRKELKRLSARLGELGALAARRLEHADELEPWCDAFLRLEASGWKGRGRSALSSDPDAELFFRAAIAGSFEAGRLEIVRLDLDGRAIAMLVNFVVRPGAFSFKTAFDEDYARFAPGVLLQIENLRILDRGDVAWMDSCAVENHPMINSLWTGRRPIVRVSVPLSGWRRSALFHLCRAAERGSAALRALARKRRQSRFSETRADDD